MMPANQHIDSEMMREAMGDAVMKALPEAIKKSASDPETWAAANIGLQKHVADKAGGWLMRLVWLFLSRVVVFVVLGSIVYAIGGWTAVVGLFGKTESVK